MKRDEKNWGRNFYAFLTIFRFSFKSVAVYNKYENAHCCFCQLLRSFFLEKALKLNVLEDI